MTSDPAFNKDLGLGPENMKTFLNYWISNYDSSMQFCDADLLKKKSEEQKDGQKNRKCTEKMFYRVTKVDESIKRRWICFSPKTGPLYCFFCKLLDCNHDSPFTITGFCDWKHAGDRLISHETSTTHLKALSCFNNLQKENQCVNVQLAKEIEASTQYWFKVLQRVIDVVLLLS